MKLSFDKFERYEIVEDNGIITRKAKTPIISLKVRG